MPPRLTPTDLLAWSVLNTATANEDTTQPTRREDYQELDPKWIDIILGRPDAARIKDCMDVIMDKEKDLQEKLANFDELELLVEGIDNANDLEPLKVWPRLLSIVEQGSEPSELRMFAAWVMATALQNNPKAQDAFERARGFPIILNALSKESDLSVSTKCLYCISAAIRHNQNTFNSFCALDGFKICVQACQQGDQSLLKRFLFLLTTLLNTTELELSQDQKEKENYDFPKSTIQAIEKNGIVQMVLQLLADDQIGGDPDCEEYLKWLEYLFLASRECLDPHRDQLKLVLSKISTDNSEATRILKYLLENI